MTSNGIAAPAADSKPTRRAGTGRPNYNQIHQFPLPVEIDPLPPLIPHNPISILSILWVWLRSTWWPTPQPVYKGIFSAETMSVHVTDSKAIRALWEAGFFGKGTLSRSEPTWLDREKRKRGLLAAETSEEITRRRRLERKKFKEDRARKEREEIEARLRQERGEVLPSEPKPDADGLDESVLKHAPDGVDAAQKGMANLHIAVEAENEDVAERAEEIYIENMEHLQLTLEEAYFLAYGLGVLQILLPLESGSSEHEIVPVSSMLSLFRAYSTFPPSVPVPSAVSPTDKFVANYAVYHHFRSLGWVIRPGPKFAVDWMLYNRGPPFSHAEFAVMTMPSYSHAFWKTDGGRTMLKNAGVKDAGKPWHWLHMVNRVQSQVRKTLVLAFVEMPPPLPNIDDEGMRAEESPTSLFGRMKVREIVIRRWIPNRHRD